MWRWPKTAIRGEIVCRVHEMGLRGGLLASAGYTGFGVADDAAIEVNPAGCNQWLEGEDDGCRIAAGIGHNSRFGDIGAMQLGQSVDAPGLCFRGGGNASSENL